MALAIRDLAVFQMGRPDTIMTYPNDPLALLAYWEGDSLDIMEFIMSLEEHFNIVIPDNEVNQLLCHMSLAEAVKYIIWKQDTATYNREAKTDAQA